MDGAEDAATSAPRPDPVPAADPARVPDMAPIRILVAEDDEFTKRYMERLLSKLGHRVRVASDGREALALLGVAPLRCETCGDGAEHREAPDPAAPPPAFDLLLLDINMPELDGFQVVEAIRRFERDFGGHLPVIAVTARSQNGDPERSLAAGMDEHLRKPVTPADLSAAIARVLSARVHARSAEVEPFGDMTLVEPVRLIAGCGGDENGLREMCRDFRTYAPSRLAEVIGAFRDRDAPRLREAARKLRELLSAFSALAEGVASRLEDCAARGGLAEAVSLVRRIEVMAGELTRQVGRLSLVSLQDQARALPKPDRREEL